MKSHGPRALVILLALAGAACGGDDGPTLRETVAGSGKHVGAAFVEGSDEPAFRRVLADEFSSMTIGLYWSAVQPSPGAFDFTATDEAFAIAAANGQRVRGHPLVWGRMALPDYVRNETDANVLRAEMTERIQAVLARYRGRVAQYDVVNEPLAFGGSNDRPDALDHTVFLELLGPGYLKEALDLAHSADPDAKLFVNEFLVEMPGPKQDRFYDLVKGLLDAGAPLHGVGFQAHVHLPPFYDTYETTYDELRASIARFAALGLDVELTELDVTLADPANELERQRTLYHDVASACAIEPGCTGLTVWGISDGASWIESVLSVDGAPLPWDAAYRAKPAYFGLRDGLAGR